MDAPTTPIPFRIATDGRSGTVEVAGRDVTAAVAGYVLEAGHGDVARLTLDVTPGALGVLDGLAVIQVAGAAVSGAAVRDLDPDWIRAAYNELADSGVDDLLEAAVEAVARVLDAQASP